MLSVYFNKTLLYYGCQNRSVCVGIQAALISKLQVSLCFTSEPEAPHLFFFFFNLFLIL